MRIAPRVVAVTTILFILTGCAVGTHSTTVAIPKLPTCDQMFVGVNHLTSEMNTEGRIPQLVPEPMRLCRYRWDNAENKLTLITDITRPLAPVALLHELNQLKTMNEVYGPNSVTSCPAGQGAVDIVIIGAATGQKLTVVDVQRDGCRRVLVTHADFASYIAYLSTARLMAQLDAINAKPTRATKNIPKFRVTPSINLRSGQQVLVQVRGALPGERLRVSECASAAAENRNGCGDQLALQPFIDTDPSGAGSITFYIKARAATKPYNTTVFQPCTDQCVIMATGGLEGTSTLVYARLKFSK